MLCAVALVTVSSGMTYRHRLNRGDDKQTSSMFHVIAIGRLRADDGAKEHVAKKIAGGRIKRSLG